LLRKIETGYLPTPAFFAAADSAQEALRAFISQHPGHLAEVFCAREIARNSAQSCAGKRDAVQVLFAAAGAELLDQFYGDGLYTSHWLSAICAAVQVVARHLPEGRGLRILEIGGGTAGLAAHLLPQLERGLHTYTFTDVSAGFFPGALQKLAAFPEVECKIFDLEKPGTEQGLASGSFDFIIGTNVLHAVSDVRATLGHLRDLLAPAAASFSWILRRRSCGPKRSSVSRALVAVHRSGIAAGSTLLERAQWERALTQAGFAEVTSLPGLIGLRVVRAKLDSSRGKAANNL
jgi:SAM-dependent methyltransferase